MVQNLDKARIARLQRQMQSAGRSPDADGMPCALRPERAHLDDG